MNNFVLLHVYFDAKVAKFFRLSQKRRDASYSGRESERIDRGKRLSAFPFVESIWQCARNNALLSHDADSFSHGVLDYLLSSEGRRKCCKGRHVTQRQPISCSPTMPLSFASLSLPVRRALFIHRALRGGTMLPGTLIVSKDSQEYLKQ